MKIKQRQMRRPAEGTGGSPKQCQTHACFHSARWHITFLDSYDVYFCTKCKDVAEEAYDNALFGWPDEPAHQVAEDYRAGKAAA